MFFFYVVIVYKTFLQQSNWKCLLHGAIAQVQTWRPNALRQPFFPHMPAYHFSHMLTHGLLPVIVRHRPSWHQVRRSASLLYPISTRKQWDSWPIVSLLSHSNDCLSTFSSFVLLSRTPPPPHLHPVFTDPSASTPHPISSSATTRSWLHGGRGGGSISLLIGEVVPQ